MIGIFTRGVVQLVVKAYNEWIVDERKCIGTEFLMISY